MNFRIDLEYYGFQRLGTESYHMWYQSHGINNENLTFIV